MSRPKKLAILGHGVEMLWVKTFERLHVVPHVPLLGRRFEVIIQLSRYY